jgi:NAD(P)-dependent dehydrogenase (short-subunit alcohol dehydrogenase family)
VPRIFWVPVDRLLMKDMSSLRGKTAVVIGASSGVGRATARALIHEEVSVVAVARQEAGLARLRAELGEPLRTVVADAADPLTAPRLLRELRPDLVVLTAGVRPRMAPLDEQTWQTFSEAWSCDVQAAFHLLQAALLVPLSPGSVVVVVSSGAAIKGSPLSGGYAGAKRMQWLMAGYAQQQSDRKQLGIRCLALLPHQLIEDTPIGIAAADAYGAWQGTSGAALMQRFQVPLGVDRVAAVIVSGLRGELASGVTAVAVTGASIESLP